MKVLLLEDPETGEVIGRFVLTGEGWRGECSADGWNTEADGLSLGTHVDCVLAHVEAR